jgi:predicted dehydrogenase
MTKLRWGMIGGGDKTSIGYIHRCAANSDQLYELVAGVFSRDVEKSKHIGLALGVAQNRLYQNAHEMLTTEATLSPDTKIQIVSIVTPNNYHFEMAKLALTLGFHIVLEKPVTFTSAEAQELLTLSQEKKLLCCVNFTNIGFPMVKEAQSIVEGGQLGKIRKINVAFTQEWLNQHYLPSDWKTKIWRTDPQKSGISCTIADIGSHAFNLAEYISCAKVHSISACLSTFVEGKSLDDDGAVLMRFDNGATGMLSASQTLIGERANLHIHIAGEHGSLRWALEQPNQIEIMLANQPKRILRAGIDVDKFSDRTKANGRTPSGADEGVIGAIANHYRNIHSLFFKSSNKFAEFPTLKEGVRSMQFIEAAVESQHSDIKWTPLHR